MMANTVKPCAATLALIMSWDLFLSPLTIDASPIDSAITVNPKPGMILIVLNRLSMITLENSANENRFKLKLLYQQERVIPIGTKGFSDVFLTIFWAKVSSGAYSRLTEGKFGALSLALRFALVGDDIIKLSFTFIRLSS